MQVRPDSDNALSAMQRGEFVKLTGNRCRCMACLEYFNSISAFDRHRVGNWEGSGMNRRCRGVSEMIEREWQKNKTGFWVEKARPRIDYAARSGDRQEPVLGAA